MNEKKPLLMYLHGFNSSSLSHKGQVMANYCHRVRPDIKVLTPQLPSFPLEAAEFITQLIESHQDDYQIGIVSSSLGGYYATWANNKFGCRAVLVNPAVKPYELLTGFLGLQTNPYTHEQYVLKEEHIAELKQLDVESICSAETLWVMLQTEDEVLDYRQAAEKFALCRQTIEKGGDHSFIDFERYAKDIVNFLNL